MIERRATLLKEKRFEGGLVLKQGTPIFVWETKSGPIGSFYPDPTKHTSHSFALADDDYSIWVRAEAQEEYLVLTKDENPDPAEVERIHEIELAQAQRTVAYLKERLAEALLELESLI